MPTVQRQADVAIPAARMYALVNDIEAYPQRFDWCDRARVLERAPERMVARLDLHIGVLRTWFVTENRLTPPTRIDLHLLEGPFRRLHGRWSFQALEPRTCRVGLSLEFEPALALLAPAYALGFGTLADRMVADFVRLARGDTG